jgi:HSP20 family protein
MLQRGEKDIARQGERQQHDDPHGRRFLSPMAQMDRLFDEVFKRPFFSLWSPRIGGGEIDELYLPVDIFEDGESVVVKAEIPGIKKEDINVQITPDSVTISGKKGGEERVEQKDYFRLERSYGSFTRTFRLPVETVADKARASFKDGVLEVRIPKSAAAAQRVRNLTVE